MTSSQAYSDNDILSELEAMGVALSTAQLRQLKSELDALLAEEDFETHSSQSASTPATVRQQELPAQEENIDPLRVLVAAQQMHEQINAQYATELEQIRQQDALDSLDPHALLRQAHVLSEAVHSDVARIDAVVRLFSLSFRLLILYFSFQHSTSTHQENKAKLKRKARIKSPSKRPLPSHAHACRSLVHTVKRLLVRLFLKLLNTFMIDRPARRSSRARSFGGANRQDNGRR